MAQLPRQRARGGDLVAVARNGSGRCSGELCDSLNIHSGCVIRKLRWIAGMTISRQENACQVQTLAENDSLGLRGPGYCTGPLFHTREPPRRAAWVVVSNPRLLFRRRAYRIVKFLQPLFRSSYILVIDVFPETAPQLLARTRQESDLHLISVLCFLSPCPNIPKLVLRLCHFTTSPPFRISFERGVA